MQYIQRAIFRKILKNVIPMRFLRIFTFWRFSSLKLFSLMKIKKIKHFFAIFEKIGFSTSFSANFRFIFLLSNKDSRHKYRAKYQSCTYKCYYSYENSTFIVHNYSYILKYIHYIIKKSSLQILSFWCKICAKG